MLTGKNNGVYMGKKYVDCLLFFLMHLTILKRYIFSDEMRININKNSSQKRTTFQQKFKQIKFNFEFKNCPTK